MVEKAHKFCYIGRWLDRQRSSLCVSDHMILGATLGASLQLLKGVAPNGIFEHHDPQRES